MRLNKIVFLVIGLFFYFSISSEVRVTCNPSGGRFGDQILAYVKMHWVAYKNGLSVLYKPFKFSEQLMLSKTDQNYYTYKGTFKNQVIILNDNYYLNPNSDCLYVVDFFYKSNKWIRGQSENSFDICEWSDLITDEVFLQSMRSKITPICAYQPLDLPKDRISIAVHVRKGSNNDLPLGSIQLYDNHEEVRHIVINKNYSDYNYPLKYPPDQFYVDQIKNISKTLNHKPLYVYIFTDDKNPKRLKEMYEATIDQPNIVFGFWDEPNEENVLYPFFALQQFDCLIRSQSNFSQAAHLIGNFKIVIYPKSTHWIGNKLIVDDVGIVNNLSQREL